MYILVINFEYPPIGGGGGVVVRDTLEHMVKLGHNATVITSHFRGLKKHETLNGVEIFRVPVLFRGKMEVSSMVSLMSYLPSCIISALILLKGRRYDIINTHFAIPSGPAGHLLSKLLHLPNVLTIQGGDIFDPSKSFSPHKTPLLSTTVQTMLNKADRVVASSNDVKANAYRYYKVNREIDIIPLGIKQPFFEKKNRQDFGLDPDEVVFCTIGRLIKRKNLDDAIEIFDDIKHQQRFKFLIIGEGPERAHLEKIIQNFGLDGRVRLLGNISDELKFQLLDLSDCYISTALHEGFGLVFLEAMECGLPVICYNRGGQNDFLINGKTGFLVQLGDKKSFHDKIVKLITDQGLKKDISLYNKKLVKNFYINHCAEKYISLFQKVILEISKNSCFESL